jgi:abortive infection bacteriophage resistance protein
MDALRYVRNLSAHHARLWNRWFIISPKLTYLYGKDFGRENTFYAQVIVMDKLIKAISPGSMWKDRLNKLFLKYHTIPYEKMGFTNNWRDDPFWEL